MDTDIQEIREKLDELSEALKENTRMTRSLYRSAKWAAFFTAIKWIAIIGATIGTFYYIQPYLNTLLKIYSSIPGIGHASSNATSSSSGSNIIDFFKNF